MVNHPTPRTSPDQRYLVERAKRFSEPIPTTLVWMADTAVQLPQELALNLIRQRRASPIADPAIVPSLILHEEDIDDVLEAQLLGAEAAAA